MYVNSVFVVRVGLNKYGFKELQIIVFTEKSNPYSLCLKRGPSDLF